MSTDGFDTPILLIIFNRPEAALKTLSAIAKVKPSVLLIAADGPRTTAEQGLCQATRDRVLSLIDWPCEVTTNFSDQNLGCGVRVYTAIDWAFSFYEQLIIMEDDCVADPTFFTYCEEMLEYYRGNQQVMHISGNNFQAKPRQHVESYYFSKYPHAWGWATWKRAWDEFDFEISRWPSFRQAGDLKLWCQDSIERLHWERVFSDVHGGKNDIWDYQWVFSCWANNGLSIVPNVNMVSNIGFGEDATHTKEKNIFLERSTVAMRDIKHPDSIDIDQAADAFTFNQNFGGFQMRRDASWIFRSKKLLRNILSKFMKAIGS
jgi:hypothetical protein